MTIWDKHPAMHRTFTSKDISADHSERMGMGQVIVGNSQTAQIGWFIDSVHTKIVTHTQISAD